MTSNNLYKYIPSCIASSQSFHTTLHFDNKHPSVTYVIAVVFNTKKHLLHMNGGDNEDLWKAEDVSKQKGRK